MNVSGMTAAQQPMARVAVMASGDMGPAERCLNEGKDEVNEMIKSLGNEEDWNEVRKVRMAEKRDCRWVYCLIVFVFFWVSLWSRLLPPSLRPLATSAASKESIWQEANRAAQTAVATAFMG